MVRLTKIYTRTGDEGSTALGDNSRVAKTDSRIEAYATVDEANSAIGLALTYASEVDQSPLVEIQHELFDLGADLATPISAGSQLPRIPVAWITKLETQIDRINARLPELDSFILPGGTQFAAALHVARTVVRRAERATWSAIEDHGDDINKNCAIYLNRLSDLLFVMAREANGGNETNWIPVSKR